jgi:hypothetical protein
MKRARRLPVWSGLVVALTVMGLAVPAQADEAAHWSPQRTGPRPTQPISALSCPTRHGCTAVNGFGATLDFDGHTWGRTRTADHDLGGLASVSCPSTSFCAAVGATVAVVEKHGHWGKVRTTDFLLTGVSCVSSHWCLAVGRGGDTLRYDGTGWHHGPSAGRADLAAISCTSRTFCLATEDTPEPMGRVFRYTGSGWRLQARVEIAGTQNLSCGSPTLCLAGGYGGATARWNGHHWTHHTFSSWDPFEPGTVSCGTHFCQLLTTEHAAQWHDGWGDVREIPGGSHLDDPSPLSCASRGHCVAVTFPYARTLRLKNGEWRFGAFPAAPDVIRALSCPTASFCMGVQWESTARMLRDGAWTTVEMPAGWHGSLDVDCTSPTFCMSVNVDGETATWDGSAWTSATQLDSVLFAFDCASPTYCVAVNTSGETRLWDGDSWTVGPTNADDPESISCPAEDDCWIGTGESSVAHFDGSTWSPLQRIAPTGVDGDNTLTVSCATTTSCLAGDQLGNTYTYDSGSWGGASHVGKIRVLDCGAERSCTVLLDDQQIGEVVSSNTGGKATRAMPRGYANRPQALSCPTSTICVMTDQSGNSWVRS